MAKSREEYNSRFKTIRVRVEDYDELLAIHDKTQVPLVGLIHLMVKDLKTKYGVESDVDSRL